MNPNNVGFSFYVYGTLPLYLLKSAASLLGITGMAEITLLGRQLAAGFATATLPLVFLTGRALYGSTVGLIAAFLFAVMALPIHAMGRRLFRGRGREHLLPWGCVLLIRARHFLTWNHMIRSLGRRAAFTAWR